MSDMQPGIRDQLVRTEHTTPELKQRYAQEVQAMYEKQLTGFGRWTWLIAAIMGIGFAVGFGTLSVVLPPEFPLLGRLGFAAGALFGLGWAILGVGIFRRASLKRRDKTAIAMMSAGLPLLVAIVVMVSAPETTGGLRMMITGVFWMVIVAIFMLSHAIDRAALDTRERLLEIEYRLAELAERTSEVMTEQPRRH